MSYNQEPSGSHRFRFYLVLATLLVVGVFALLLFNNNGQSFGLSSAIVGESSSDDSLGLIRAEEDDSSTSSFLDKTKSSNKGTRNLELDLQFDQIPTVTAKTKVNSLTIKFRDTQSKIKINSDVLELNNLQDVTLQISGFDGNLAFNSNALSLDGKATRIEVNNVVLAAKSEIRILVDNLNYDDLIIENIALGELKIPLGNGIIDLGSKLHYDLVNEQLQLYSYTGSFRASPQDLNRMVLKGTARKVDMQGDTLSVSVQ